MTNRTAAVIITILAILFCGCPGLAFLCFGVTDFVDYYALNSYIYGITNQNSTITTGVLGICGGVLFIAIAVVVSILVLRQRRVPPTNPSEPVPPTM